MSWLQATVTKKTTKQRQFECLALKFLAWFFYKFSKYGGDIKVLTRDLFSDYTDLFINSFSFKQPSKLSRLCLDFSSAEKKFNSLLENAFKTCSLTSGLGWQILQIWSKDGGIFIAKCWIVRFKIIFSEKQL